MRNFPICSYWVSNSVTWLWCQPAWLRYTSCPVTSTPSSVRVLAKMDPPLRYFFKFEWDAEFWSQFFDFFCQTTNLRKNVKFPGHLSDVSPVPSADGDCPVLHDLFECRNDCLRWKHHSFLSLLWSCRYDFYLFFSQDSIKSNSFNRFHLDSEYSIILSCHWC